MPDTFDSDVDLDEDEFDEDDSPVGTRTGRPRQADEVPDSPVENAGDLPLLVHASTGKKNTVTYLKITRLDGARGVRGVKGKLDPGSTFEDVARRFGNGTYKIEGCNYKHQTLAREDGVEISIPGYDEDADRPVMPIQSGVSPSFGLHGMKLISDMSDSHARTVTSQANSQAENVQAMASRTMEMLTAFTTAQRESERATHESSTANQQQFYATMMAMQAQAHAQQMEQLRAMHERQHGQQIDPLQLVEVFMNGLKAGGELGGGSETEPWIQALREGTGMMGHLASLANAPGVQQRLGQLPGQVPNPSRALPNPSASRASQAPATPPEPAPRKKRLPFKTDEIRSIAALKATLRERGIPLTDFLEQTRQHIATAPDEELFSDDGPDESDDDAENGQSPGDDTPE